VAQLGPGSAVPCLNVTYTDTSLREGTHYQHHHLFRRYPNIITEQQSFIRNFVPNDLQLAPLRLLSRRNARLVDALSRVTVNEV